MNQTFFPIYRTKYGRYDQFVPVTGRVPANGSGDLFISPIERQVVARGLTDAAVFVIDKLVVTGWSRSATANVSGTFRIYDAPTGGSLVASLPIHIPNGAVCHTGTASTGTVSTLTQATATFGVNIYRGYQVVTTGGTGAGQTRAIASNTATVLTVTDVFNPAPDVTTTYSVICPSGQGRVEIPFGGSLCLPPNYRLMYINSANCDCVPEAIGTFMPTGEAAKLGIWPGLENWFCVGVDPNLVVATELIPARAGFSIEQWGSCFTGSPQDIGDLYVFHFDGAISRGVQRFPSGGGCRTLAPIIQTRIGRNMPIGHSVRYTASAAMQNRYGYFTWGRYTKDPDTYNPDGLHSIKGTCTAASVGAVLTDTSRNWVVNVFTGRVFDIVAGTGAGTSHTCASNTATTITMSGAITPALDTTSVYRMRVADGSKWWVFFDAASNANNTDSVYELVPSEKEVFAEIQAQQYCGDSRCTQFGGAPDTPISPPTISLNASIGLYRGSGLANAGLPGGGAAAAAFGLFVAPTSAVYATSPGADLRFATDGNPSVMELKPGSLTEILAATVSCNWAMVSGTVDGRFIDPARYSPLFILTRINGV